MFLLSETLFNTHARTHTYTHTHTHTYIYIYIAGFLRWQHIKMAFKPVKKTIGSILRKPKEKVPTEDSTGIIYEISCKQCDKIYIEQTAWALKTRVKEHKRAITKDDKLSLIAAHRRETNHDFDFDDTKIIDCSANWNQQTFLEAWHSINKPNSINEHILTYHIYRLFQPLSWTFYSNICIFWHNLFMIFLYIASH